MAMSRTSSIFVSCMSAIAFAVCAVGFFAWTHVVATYKAVKVVFKEVGSFLFLKKPKPKCEPAITVSRMRQFTARMFTRNSQRPTLTTNWRSCPSC